MSAARPEPPGQLGDAGAALWRAVLEDLSPDVELTAVEQRRLESACACRDDIARLEAAIDADGPTVMGSRGNVRPHPAYDLILRARALEARLLDKIDTEPPAELTPRQHRAKRAAELRWARRAKAG